MANFWARARQDWSVSPAAPGAGLVGTAGGVTWSAADRSLRGFSCNDETPASAVTRYQNDGAPLGDAVRHKPGSWGGSLGHFAASMRTVPRCGSLRRPRGGATPGPPAPGAPASNSAAFGPRR